MATDIIELIDSVITLPEADPFGTDAYYQELVREGGGPAGVAERAARDAAQVEMLQAAKPEAIVTTEGLLATNGMHRAHRGPETGLFDDLDSADERQPLGYGEHLALQAVKSRESSQSAELGWQAVGWTIDTAAWLGERGISAMVALMSPRDIGRTLLSRGPFNSSGLGARLHREHVERSLQKAAADQKLLRAVPAPAS